MENKKFVLFVGFIAILAIISGCIKETEETGTLVQEKRWTVLN